MTVRLKITLLITAAGLLSSLVFSVITLREMVEQPFDLIDAELKSMARRALQQPVTDKAPGTAAEQLPFLDQERYWLQISAQDSGAVLYRSQLAEKIAIPGPENGKKKATRRIEVPESLDFDEDECGRVAFRILCNPGRFKGQAAQACVARPIEELQEELWDTVEDVTTALAFSMLLLLGASYVAAAFILKPIKALNAQARDISERRLERRLPVTGGPDEFNALARTLNQVFDRLQHAFLRQKRLIADASHELKTPLTMMRLILDNAQENVNEQDEGQAQNLERLTLQVLRMERLVKNLLDLSSLEAESRLNCERIDLSELLESLLTDYRALAEPRRIRIEAAMPEQVLMLADAERLYRAFSNLLDNAIKYNVDGGKVELTVRESPLAVDISIENTGPAVPAADWEKVFEQFYRVDKSRSLKHGGSGLGLAIVKRIIELHGGTVRMESEADERTNVVIYLPVSAGTKTEW